MFLEGDIIINFRRNTIYVYSETDKARKREFFFCRYASFDEIERYLMLGKPVAKISEIGIKGNYQKWKAKDQTTVQISLTGTELFRLQRYARTYNYNSYKTLILGLLDRVNNPDTDIVQRFGEEQVRRIEALRKKIERELTEYDKHFKQNLPKL